MLNLSDWLSDMRNFGALSEQRDRDRRRREHQGRRDGYAHSGEPSPVPVYMGPPASGAEDTGITSETEVGTGGTIILDIDHSSEKTIWTFHSVHTIVGAERHHMDKDYRLTAYNGATPLGTVSMFEAATGHATGGHHTAISFRVPSTRLRIFILNSTIGTTYVATAIWEESR